MSSSTSTSLLPNFTVEPGCTGTAKTPPGTAVGSAEACAPRGAKLATDAATATTRARLKTFRDALREICALIRFVVVMILVPPLFPG